MDISLIIAAALGVLGMANLWLLFSANGYRTKQADQDRRIRDLEVQLPREYVSKKSLDATMAPMKEDIRDIKQMLLRKATFDVNED